MKHRSGTFQAFKEHTLAVARGERRVAPGEPTVWCDPVDADARTEVAMRFPSLEAGAKLLSAKNRTLLRAIAERQPQSVAELSAITGRAEQNVLRTLNKLAAAGVIRLDKGPGRARRPVLAARKVHFEINLVESE